MAAGFQYSQVGNRHTPQPYLELDFGLAFHYGARFIDD